jgi:hypothetical protein
MLSGSAAIVCAEVYHGYDAGCHETSVRGEQAFPQSSAHPPQSGGD